MFILAIILLFTMIYMYFLYLGWSSNNLDSYLNIFPRYVTDTYDPINFYQSYYRSYYW